MKIRDWEQLVTKDEETPKFLKKKPKSKKMLGEEWVKSGKKPVEKRKWRSEN
jgi:hypothetical protein